MLSRSDSIEGLDEPGSTVRGHGFDRASARELEVNHRCPTLVRGMITITRLPKFEGICIRQLPLSIEPARPVLSHSSCFQTAGY